eukprot:g7949.t1
MGRGGDNKSEASPDFHWSPTDEPHKSRRAQILAKYPQIKKLYGHCPQTKWKTLVMVSIQVAMSAWMSTQAWWAVLACTYTVGGTINHALELAVHEITHNLAFRSVKANRALAFFANLPLGLPVAASFKRYHSEHHRYQGEDVVDVDIPSDWERQFFTGIPLKTLWMFLQPLFYALRPMVVNPKSFSPMEGLNWCVQLTFDAFVVWMWGWKALFYLFFSTLLGMGIHPVSGHFVAEHYTFSPGVETYSYYGPMNALTFNVGYHNEHHDFPFIPGSRLPRVRQIAPEFYEPLPKYHSWCGVIGRLIFSDAGLWDRMKRKTLKPEQIASMKAQ